MFELRTKIVWKLDKLYTAGQEALVKGKKLRSCQVRGKEQKKKAVRRS
jgi:hypothetical protein